MEIIGYTVLVTIAVSLLYTVIGYNRLVTLKHNVRKAWRNIDILLKQRHDEIPKLIALCKAYMKHEQETFEKVISARSRVATAREAGDLASLSLAEGALRAGIGQLFALVENYPDLKANENFRHLEGRVTGLENAIADRREFYNETVNIINIRLEQFPDVVIARLFNFRPFELLRFTEQDKVDVNVAALFQAS
ncbi:MAG: LemA family protein [Gammaproteobacteria bacterium]